MATGAAARWPQLGAGSTRAPGLCQGLGGQCRDWWGGMAPPTHPLSPSRMCSLPWWARSENGAEGEKTVPGKSHSSQRSGTKTSTSRTGPRTLRARGGESRRAPAAVLPWPAWGTTTFSSPTLCRLSVGGEGSPFEQQAAGAVLDLMGDENHNLNKSKQLLKW